MNEDGKKMNYSIGPITKMVRAEMSIAGGLQKKAETLEGTWVRLNETEYIIEEADQTTRILIEDDVIGCSCGKCDHGIMCVHVLAFEALKSPPQLSIESSQCRGLREVLLSEGWYAENRYIYPSLDEATNEPRVVAELPPVNDEKPDEGEQDTSTKLDPVREEKELDIGVGNAETEASPIDEGQKMYTRECQRCGFVTKGHDLDEVKQRMVEHQKTCSKNPANKKKAKVPEKPKPIDAKPSPVENDKMKAKPKQKNTEVSTDVVMPSDAEFRDAKTERILQSQGGFYKVAGGKEVPDAMAVQAYAVGTAGISTEVMKIEQDDKHVLAIVRCHRGGLYTDASVYIDFEVQRKRELLKIANKNPKAVRGWDERGPMFDPDFKVVTESKSVPLMVHIFNRMTDFQYFAPRTAESQAIRRGQAKMLGSEWRDAEEINTEAEEVSSINRK